MPAPSVSRLSKDAQRLLSLTTALSRSGSRLEDDYWEHELNLILNKLLLGKKNKTVENALDHLITTDPGAYEILVEQAETQSESTSVVIDGIEHDALLFSAPLVAWTRYQLPGTQLVETQRDGLLNALHEHIAAPGARLAIIPALVGFEQMPQTFQETRAWTQRLALQALGKPSEPYTLRDHGDNDGMLADARFLIGVIAVPRGEPLFQWQARQGDGTYPSRESCRDLWVSAANRILATTFTGCQVEYLQPDAYYVNSREADRRIRPLALKAAVTWLQNAVQAPGSELRAVIAGCGENIAEEYRVGFSTRHSNDVIYGCIWPVLSKEEAANDGMETGEVDMTDEIAALLKELGISDVRRLPGLYSVEFCDDCGAPYFPNALGEMLHPELPEETDLDPIQFH